MTWKKFRQEMLFKDFESGFAQPEGQKKGKMV